MPQVAKFIQLYTPDHIIHTVMLAMNEHPRKVGYEPAMDWFMSHPPPGWDKYDFLEQVVCDMDTGAFTRNGVAYMLMQNGFLKPIDRGNDVEAELEAYIDSVDVTTAPYMHYSS